MRQSVIGLAMGAGLVASGATAEEVTAPTSNHPDWSPDGQEILFASDLRGDDDLYLMRADGSARRFLLGGPGRQTYPAFSPDQRTIAFIQQGEAGFTIRTGDVKGGNLSKITRQGSSFEPRFSADGRWLVYTSIRDRDADIYLYDLVRGEERRLVGLPGQQGFPSFSPDGHEVIFQSRVGEFDQLFTVAFDGSGLRQLTRFDANSLHGHISPDGRRFVFDSDMETPGNRDGREIYVMNLDGTGLSRLTRNQARDGYPKWSPDGNRIAFHSTRDGQFEIYVMDADGANQVRLTGRTSSD